MKELNINRSMLRPAGPSVWGEIYGDIQDQKDLINLIEGAGVTPEDREKIDKIDGIEAGLSTKADRSELPDMSNYATKPELNNKADRSELPDMSNYATQGELQSTYNELNNKIGDLTAITEEILGV